MEEAVKDLQKFCRERERVIDARLSEGAKTFENHEGRIKELEKDTSNLCAKFMVMNNRLNQILGSVVVACVLLAINILIGRF